MNRTQEQERSHHGISDLTGRFAEGQARIKSQEEQMGLLLGEADLQLPPQELSQ